MSCRQSAALGCLVLLFTLMGWSTPRAASTDRLLRLGAFRHELSGVELWRTLYPVPQREPLLAYG
jgi:hypothetical protein